MALVTRQLTNVGAPLYTPGGVLLANKTITFTLVNGSGAPTSAFDGTTKERVVGVVTATTSAGGEFTVSLWPNDRGDKLTKYACMVDYPGAENFSSTVSSGGAALTWLEFKLNGAALTPTEFSALATHMADTAAHGAAGGVEDKAHKDASGGYVGKTLEKINFWNAARTFMSFFTNTATAARTYTFQDRDGTIADNIDIASREATANKDASGGYVGKTLEKINFWNAARTFMSFFTNTATAARTYTFQDRDGTIADTTNILEMLNTKNSWSKAQIGAPVSLAVSANAVAVDLALSNNFTLALQATTSQVLSNPTNAAAGQSGSIYITQNATPSALTFGTYWIEETSGTAATVSTTASAQNSLHYEVFDATHIYYVLNKHGVA